MTAHSEVANRNNKTMRHIYTDASFDYRHVESAQDNVARGKIAISGEGMNQIEKVVVGIVPNLKQYINIFELIAISRAIEVAWLFNDDENPELTIHSDSMVALAWAHKKKIPQKIETEAHRNALDYLKRSVAEYKGKISFFHIGRNYNPAGFLLEEELKREAPHTK